MFHEAAEAKAGDSDDIIELSTSRYTLDENGTRILSPIPNKKEMASILATRRENFAKEAGKSDEYLAVYNVLLEIKNNEGLNFVEKFTTKCPNGELILGDIVSTAQEDMQYDSNLTLKQAVLNLPLCSQFK